MTTDSFIFSSSPVRLFNGWRWGDGRCHGGNLAQEMSPAIHVRYTGDDGDGGGDDGELNITFDQR